MKRGIKWASGVGIFVAAGVLAPSALMADDAGGKELAKVDDAESRFKTNHFVYDVAVKSGDKTRNLQLDVKLKNTSNGTKRLTEFLAPADMKGTKVLILSPTEMYIYLPAFGKVRRIASHTAQQSLMGMTFTQDDMLLTTYGPMYTATVSSSDDKGEKLALTQIKDSGAPYAKLDVQVDKSNMLPTLVDYYGDDGTKLKTETRATYTCEGTTCSASELKMVDHTKGDDSTTLTRKSWKLNEDFSDEIFTTRSLDK